MCTVSGASDVYIDVSALYLDLSGDADRDFMGGAVSNEHTGFVPRVGIGYFLTESWAVELSYTRFGTIKGNGISPVGNPIPGPGDSIPVMTPYEVTEKIHASAISLLYNLEILEGLSLKMGPNLTYFRNELSVKGENTLFLKETREDFRMGADASLDYGITENLSVSFDYHYLNPPHKDAHLFGVSAALRF